MSESHGSGRSDSRKRKSDKKQYYIRAAKMQRIQHKILGPGIRGFIGTCNKSEKNCVSEAMNLLNEYVDVPEPEEKKPEGDVLDEMEEELNKLREEFKNPEKQFHSLYTNVKNCVFIKTTVENPVELHHKIFSDLHAKQEQKTKHLLRFLPVDMTCKVDIDEIKKEGKKYLEKFFLNEGKSFHILVKVRNNSKYKSQNIIQPILNMIRNMNAKNTPDFNNPELFVIVEILKNVFCMSVCKDYNKFFRFNTIEASTKLERPKKEKNKGIEVKVEKIEGEKITDISDEYNIEIINKGETLEVKVEEVKKETDVKLEDDSVPKLISDKNVDSDIKPETNVDDSEIKPDVDSVNCEIKVDVDSVIQEIKLDDSVDSEIKVEVDSVVDSEIKVEVNSVVDSEIKVEVDTVVPQDKI